MKELDLLKKDWQSNENSFEQVSATDIYKMIHKKSSTIVKRILIISILEVLLWTAISIIYNTDDYLARLKHDEIIFLFKGLTYFNYGVILVFIYLFYKNYQVISTTVATKQLMKDILKTRKTVQYYVYYNLALVAISSVISVFAEISYSPKLSNFYEKHQVALFALSAGITLVLFTFFWLFYKLLYGILLKKLNQNYNELKKYVKI